MICSASQGSTAAFGLFLALSAIGCTNDASTTTGTYLIRGTAEGISGSGVVLQDNGADDLHVTGNGEFFFNAELPSGSAYAVTLAESTQQVSCKLTHDTGTVSGNDVTDVSLVCTRTYSLSGAVSGLTSDGLILQNNGGDAIALTHDGVFVFDKLKDGAAFDLEISQNPAGETCTVQSSGRGTIASADVTNINVTCAGDLAHVVRGTVNGLTSGSLILQNGADAISIASDGAFYFPKALARGDTYAVALAGEFDTAQACTISNGAGTIDNADVSDVTVDCTN